MTKFYVDLPNPAIRTSSDDNAYINVGVFDTLAEARAWLQDVHGMPKEIAYFFITEA